MLLRILAAVPRPLAGRLERLLAAEGVRLTAVHGSPWGELERADWDLVVLARARLGTQPVRAFERLQRIAQAPEVIVLWDEEDPLARANMLGNGAMAVLNSTLDDEALLQALRALLARRRDAAVQRYRALRGEPPASLADFVSQSPEMQRLLAVAQRMLDSDASLLVLGETGVGKERLARAIHDEGTRRAGPFVAINCGAVPEALLESELFGHEEGAFTGAVRAHRGLFELAHGGTLFLDEVGDTPPALQVKLLRALQDKRIRPLGAEHDLAVDVRVVAATNRDLQAEMRAGRFRPDLFYRLSVVALTIPPLRERRADIPDLVRNHLEALCARMNRRPITVDDDAMARLAAHDWPGNVRELVNVLERAVLLGDGGQLMPRDLPPAITAPTAVAGTAAARELLELPYAAARQRVLDDFERSYFDRLLRDCGGRVGAAARRAGLSPRTLFARMMHLGLRKEDYRSSREAAGRNGPPVAPLPPRAS